MKHAIISTLGIILMMAIIGYIQPPHDLTNAGLGAIFALGFCLLCYAIIDFWSMIEDSVREDIKAEKETNEIRTD